MIGAGMRRGERPRAAEWLGLAIALGGLAIMTSPGRTAPDIGAALLMAVAGVAWGVYSLRGRRGGDPLVATAGNFLRGVPLVLAVSAAAGAGLLGPLGDAHVSARGATLAAISGSVTSGIGYSLWYSALPSLTATRAALVQLSVPVLAAVGGVVILGEAVTSRLLLGGSAILAGVAVAVLARRARA